MLKLLQCFGVCETEIGFSEVKGVEWGHAVAQLVEVLRYKSEGRGFESRWRHWYFSLT